MKKKIFILTMMLLTLIGGGKWNVLNAQEDYIVGNGEGGTTGYIPTYTYEYYSYSQQIYPSSLIEFEASEITKIAFHCSSSSSNSLTRNIDVYMANTTKESFSGNGDWDKDNGFNEANKVFSGDFVVANGWCEIVLNTPFKYDGTNILVCVNDKTASLVSGYKFYKNADSGTANTALYVYTSAGSSAYDQNYINSNNGRGRTNSNQIRFTYESSGPAVMPSSVPEITSIEATHNSVTLAWNAVENANKYNVYTSTGDLVETVNTTSCTIEGLNDLTEYCYQVSAVNGEYETGKSAERCTTTLEAPETRDVVFVLHDTYGDSWNGGMLSIKVNGVDYETLTNQNLDNNSNNSSTGGETQTYTITFNVGDEITITYTPSNYASENNYYVYYDKDGGDEIFTGNGDEGSKSTTFVVSKALPVLSVVASDYDIFSDEETTLTATAANFDGDVTYSWSYNGEIVGNESTYTFAPTTAGTFTFTCTATDANNEASADVTINVTERPALDLNVTADKVEIYQGFNTMLYASATGGFPPYNFNWFLNGEEYGTGEACYFNQTEIGEYTITCKVTDANGGTTEKSVTINVFANPFAGRQFRIEVMQGDYAGYYLDVYNDNGTIGVESKTERNTQIFTIEKIAENQYYLKTADGYYIKCETGGTWWNVHAYNTYDKTPLVFEYTGGEQFYIKDYDKMTGNSQTGSNDPNNCYFKVENQKVYCDAPINKYDSESHRTVLWSLEEIIQIEPIALTANPEEVTVGENITFTVLQGDTDATSASKFYIEDEEITNPYTTTVAGTFTIRAEKDGLEATTSIIVNEAVEPDPEDPVTPGNGETVFTPYGAVTYNKGMENEYTLLVDMTTYGGDAAVIMEDNVNFSWGDATNCGYVQDNTNKPNAETSLTIPAYVLNGTTKWIPVTEIADYAFDSWTQSLTDLPENEIEPGNERNDLFTSLVIPNTVTNIGQFAFSCELEGPIFCYASTPPTCEVPNNIYYPFLTNTYNNAILYVPAGSIDAYKTAVGWSRFKTIASLTISTFENKVDDDWANADNWKKYIEEEDGTYTETWGSLPNAGEDVLINGDAVIPAGYTANVGAINIVSGGITVKDGGQLIHTNAGVTVTVEKEIKGYNATREGVASTAWNTISSPIAVLTPTSNVNGLLNGAYDLYYYDEPTHYWINHEQETNEFKTLDAGRGYLYANENDVTLKFNGVINYDNVSFNLNASSDNEGLHGFNLIGNPFTHDIYMGGNIYSENLIIDGYYSLSQEGQWGAKKASSSAIAPCQGILVQTSKEETINIVKSAAAPARSAQAALNITVVNEQYEDNAYVIFNDGKGLNKVGHMNENIPMVYVIDNNEKFAIANIDDANEIALGFEAMTMGEYTIAVKAQDCKFNNMILTDNITGEKTNLMTDSYTFMATTNDEPNRFTLTLNNDNDNDNDNDFIYIHNNEMIINNIEGNGLVQIYDMMGRSVATYNVSGSANISMETLSNGVYVVRMTDANGVKTQKVVNN